MIEAPHSAARAISSPVVITGNAAFGGLELPEGNSAVLGTQVYKSASYKEGSPALLVEANTAFGGIEIK